MIPTKECIYLYDLEDTLTAIRNTICEKQQLLITAININILYRLSKSEDFRALFTRFDKITFDGYYSILWANLLLKKKNIEQVSADRMLKEVFRQAGSKKWKICVLGGSPETETRFKDMVLKTFPESDIAYHHNGYFDEPENDCILKEINDLSPDILLIGLSVPKEHEWCIRNKSNLNAKVIITCGGYIEQTSQAGLDYYPSTWIYKFHINWIYRIFKEPARLWRRYLTQGLWFACWLPRQYIKSRIFNLLNKNRT